MGRALTTTLGKAAIHKIPPTADHSALSASGTIAASDVPQVPQADDGSLFGLSQHGFEFGKGFLD